jgi:hypothetical protein
MDLQITTTSRTKCILGATLAVAAMGLCPNSVSAAPNPSRLTGVAVSIDVGVVIAPSVSESATFQWSDIPQNQNIPIQRSVFDRGGYQLYDASGDAIVVPFTNNNLYVLKFAVSGNGETYFVNTGQAPVLYLPENGYVQNGTDPSAHWYPFSTQFHPASPVYVGIAPTWSAYVSMGWYPNENYWGGYWGQRSFVSGGVFVPSAGLYFQIGGSSYQGWGGYRNYYNSHPAPYQVGYWNRNVYTWAARPASDRRSFGGGNYRGQHSTVNVNIRSTSNVTHTTYNRVRRTSSAPRANTTRTFQSVNRVSTPRTNTAPTFQGGNRGSGQTRFAHKTDNTSDRASGGNARSGRSNMGQSGNRSSSRDQSNRKDSGAGRDQ